MAEEHVTSGYYEGLTLSQIEKHILWELGQVTDALNVSFNRFPRWLIRDKLNDRQNQFVFQSQCLKKFALLKAKANYRRYKLPVNCMDGGILAVKYYDSATSYVELEIVDREYMDREWEGWLTEDASEPQYVLPGDSYGNIPTIDVHPRPSADGTTYTDGTDVGIAVGDEMPSATNNVSGLATGGSGTTLEDSEVDFTTMGFVGGMYVRNVTDASYAYLESVSAHTLTLAAALTGGTANTFSAGDSYDILAGEYGVVTSWEADDQILFGADVGLLASITVPAGNFRVDFIPYPMAFPQEGNDLQKPEIPRLYHMGLAMGVVADLLRTFNEGSKEFQRAEFYEKIFQTAWASAAGKKYSRPFDRKPVAMRPRMR